MLQPRPTQLKKQKPHTYLRAGLNELSRILETWCLSRLNNSLNHRKSSMVLKKTYQFGTKRDRGGTKGKKASGPPTPNGFTQEPFLLREREGLLEEPIAQKIKPRAVKNHSQEAGLGLIKELMTCSQLDFRTAVSWSDCYCKYDLPPPLLNGCLSQLGFPQGSVDK